MEVWWSKDTSSSKPKMLASKQRKRDEDRPAIGTPSKGNARGKSNGNAKNNCENGDCIRWTTEHAQPGMTRTRKAKGRDDLVHLHRQVYKMQSAKWMQIRRHVCFQTHSKNCWWQEKSQSITFHRCNYGKFSRMPRPKIETSPSRQQVRSEKRKMGPTLGAIQTGHQNQRNPNAPTEWSLSMEEIARKAAWISHSNVYKVPGSCSENRNNFFKPSPAINVSSSSFSTSRERGISVDSGASLLVMSKSDLTPEEQETIQRSEDPSVIMTANGNTTEEATVYVCYLDMFVQVQFLKESPAVLSLGKLCRMKRHSGQPSYLIKNERNIECQTDSRLPLVVPDAQATDHDTRALGDRKGTPAVGDHDRSVETEIPEWLQPPPVDVAVPHPAISPSAHPPAKCTSNKSGGRSHNLFSNFPKDPNCEVCRRTKVTRAPCRRNPDDRADRIQIAEKVGDMITAYHKVLDEDWESRRHYRCTAVVQDLATQWIHSYPCKTNSDQETQRNLKKFSRPERSIHTDNSLELIEACEELNWIRNTWICRTSCTTSERRNFVSVGSVWTAR